MGYKDFLTWKELKKRSMNSFVRRRDSAPCEVDSSVTNENRTEWIPSNGIRVRVDLASLKMGEKHKDRQLIFTQIYKFGHTL